MSRTRAIIVVGALLGLAACGKSPESAQPDSGPQDTGQPAGPTAEAGSAPPPAFAQCMSCHSPKPGVNGVGPSLFGVVGRKAGTLPGYAYSDALKAWGKTLDPAELDAWLTAPMKDVPGTKMVFPGIPDPERRKAVIDYLTTLK